MIGNVLTIPSKIFFSLIQGRWPGSCHICVCVCARASVLKGDRSVSWGHQSCFLGGPLLAPDPRSGRGSSSDKEGHLQQSGDLDL